MKRSSSVLLGLSLLGFLGALVLWMLGRGAASGPLVVGAFVLLAIGSRGHAVLKSCCV